VLPSLNKRLFVALSPTRISMLMLGRGYKPKIVARYDEILPPPSLRQPWELVLNRFTQLLSQPEWQKVEVSTVLSNQLFRFEVMTLGAQLKQYSAQEAFAKYTFSHAYGTKTEHWTLCIQSGKKDAPRLVSAIDKALLEGLQQACTAHQLQLKLVTPYLTPLFNRFQKQFTSALSWLVIHESGYTLMALLSAGRFVAINGVYHDTIEELPMLLDRENLVCTLQEPCIQVLLYAPTSSNSLTIPKSKYQIKKLELAVPDGFPRQTEGLFSMLMSECL
jgi:hypothetical protein